MSQDMQAVVAICTVVLALIIATVLGISVADNRKTERYRICMQANTAETCQEVLK